MMTSILRKMPVLCSLTFAILTAAPHAGAQVKCALPDGGRYTWGESPKGCDAQGLGDVSRSKSLYGAFIYDIGKKNESAHVKSYMTNMNALIRDLASGYIKRRLPGVSQDEVNTFVKAMHAVATQESYWTHYRFGKDGRLKIMTGDSDLSMGMMQLHENSLATQGRLARFDLVNNILLGIEHYYGDWMVAKNASCYKNAKAADKLTALARSAYGSYNGGPKAACRWQDKTAKWYVNDVGYLEKYAGRPWAKNVTDANKVLDIDLECIKAGRTACQGRSDAAPEQQKPVEQQQTQQQANGLKAEQLVSKLVTLEDGRQCYSSDGKSLHCSKDARTFSCLEAYAPGLAKMDVLKVSSKDAVLKSFSVSIYSNRDELCKKAIEGLATAGEFVSSKQDLDLLDGKDGAKVSSLKAGSVVQVVDYEVAGEKAAVQYRVAAEGKLLWIVAGEKAANVAKSSDEAANKAAVHAIPVAGDKVSVAVEGGVNFRAQPGTGGQIIGGVGEGDNVVVKGLKVINGMGELWIAVEVDGDQGYISAGRTSPELTTSQWVSFTK